MSTATLSAAVSLAQIERGVYTIMNLASHALVTAESTGEFIRVFSQSVVPPGNYPRWKVEPAKEKGSFTIQNVAKETYATVGANGEIVPTSGNNQEDITFAIQPAGEGRFTIKELNKDSLWAYSPITAGVGKVYLSPASGSELQGWVLSAVEAED